MPPSALLRTPYVMLNLLVLIEAVRAIPAVTINTVNGRSVQSIWRYFDERR